MSMLLVHIIVLMAVLVANGSAQPNERRTTPKPTTTTTPSSQRPVVWHKTSNLKLIWNNRGSRAEDPCSIWRAERGGYNHTVYPVGDVVYKSLLDHYFTYVVEMPDPRVPVSYTKIWNDADSGAVLNVTIWRVKCPQGYFALGNVATDGSEPSPGSIYCVNGNYALLGQKTDWKLAWKNSGSSAANPVAIYVAVASTTQQQAVYGFGAIASYGGKPDAPYFLNNGLNNVNDDQ